MPSLSDLLVRLLWKAVLPIGFSVGILVLIIPQFKSDPSGQFDGGVWSLIAIAVGIWGLWKLIRVPIEWNAERHAARSMAARMGQPLMPTGPSSRDFMIRLFWRAFLPLGIAVGSTYLCITLIGRDPQHTPLYVGLFCLIGGVSAVKGIWGLITVPGQWDFERQWAGMASVESRLRDLPLETLRHLVQREIVPSKQYTVSTEGELSSELRAQLGPAMVDFFAQYREISREDEALPLLYRDNIEPWEADPQLRWLTGEEEYDYVFRPGEDGIYQTQEPPDPADRDATYPTIYHLLLSYHFGDSTTRLERALERLAR